MSNGEHATLTPLDAFAKSRTLFFNPDLAFMASASATAPNSPKNKHKRLSTEVTFPVHSEEPSVVERSPDQDNGSTLTSSVVEKQSFLQRLWSWSPVLVLENSGSVARDHLASERTWLAYIRTSLAVSSSGVALVQLFTIAANRNPDNNGFATRIQTFARPLGATMVLIGLSVCLLGLYRYFAIQKSLTTGKFPTARFEVHAISLLLGTLTGIVFGVLIAYPR